ncbi:hypothetical protein EB796_016298 [Bugula neritina]|uniref:CUB domain-containing protein n=1 Tax=Bugula neritina TaxID=10212 RepID=A0A7J7JH85_BUGNE|nr:hypothetical protein EB796_016298 [Bugula neritina]
MLTCVLASRANGKPNIYNIPWTEGHSNICGDDLNKSEIQLVCSSEAEAIHIKRATIRKQAEMNQTTCSYSGDGQNPYERKCSCVIYSDTTESVTVTTLYADIEDHPNVDYCPYDYWSISADGKEDVTERCGKSTHTVEHYQMTSNLSIVFIFDAEMVDDVQHRGAWIELSASKTLEITCSGEVYEYEPMMNGYSWTVSSTLFSSFDTSLPDTTLRPTEKKTRILAAVCGILILAILVVILWYVLGKKPSLRRVRASRLNNSDTTSSDLYQCYNPSLHSFNKLHEEPNPVASTSGGHRYQESISLSHNNNIVFTTADFGSANNIASSSAC